MEMHNVKKAIRQYVRHVHQLVLEPAAASSFKPSLWVDGDKLIEVYQQHIPRMRKRSCFTTMSYEERLHAVFSHAAYRFISDKPITKIDEYTLVPELSDEHSVVFSTHAELGVTTKLVVAFRGTHPLKISDIITDVFITLGKESETERFIKAVDKIRRLQEMFPIVPITVCGHSLGGTQAIYVSKLFKLKSYTYNPAQGISLKYLDEIDKHPQIRVLRVISDPVSCIAGLENVNGLILFPQVSSISMTKNHSLLNFLPSDSLPPVVKL
jgi:hypothetical protein